VTASDRAIAEHLLSCSTALYEVLGESAPTFSNDAYVIRGYEMSRAFGTLALETRDYLGDASPVPFDVLTAVLRASVHGDETRAPRSVTTRSCGPCSTTLRRSVFERSA
jgi:hypothetical protein